MGVDIFSSHVCLACLRRVMLIRSMLQSVESAVIGVSYCICDESEGFVLGC